MFFNEIFGPCLAIRGEIGQAMPCSSEGRELRLRDAINKKKLADLRTYAQLSLPSPPLSPISTNLNWDIFKHRYPSPPSCNEDNMPLNFLFGHEL